MFDDLRGAAVLVVGGTRGIGLAAATALVELGTATAYWDRHDRRTFWILAVAAFASAVVGAFQVGLA